MTARTANSASSARAGAAAAAAARVAVVIVVAVVALTALYSVGPIAVPVTSASPTPTSGRSSDLLEMVRRRHVLSAEALIKGTGVAFDSHVAMPQIRKKNDNKKDLRKVIKKRRINKKEDDDDEEEIKIRHKRGGGRTDPGRAGRARGYSRSDPDDFSDICGRQKETFTRFRPTFRILNGTCAQYGELPWVAQIQTRSPGGGPDGTDFSHSQHCGGTIIAEDLILTAAHCFQIYSHSFMRVVVGQHDLTKLDKEEQVFDIEEVERHPKWDSPREGRYSNDIALVKLRRKGDGSGIRFSANVAPACLPEEDLAFPEGSKCVIAGWGKTESQGSVHTDCLQAATVPIISNEVCQEMYSSSGNKRIGRGMTCAGYRDGGVDTCKGDSGGPLACSVNDRFHIYGVVSWGEGCGAANRPGVYSRVQYYREWIRDTAEKLNRKK